MIAQELTFDVISPGQSTNAILHEVVHTTINANGTTTSQFINSHVDCTGPDAPF